MDFDLNFDGDGDSNNIDEGDLVDICGSGGRFEASVAGADVVSEEKGSATAGIVALRLIMPGLRKSSSRSCLYWDYQYFVFLNRLPPMVPVLALPSRSQ